MAQADTSTRTASSDTAVAPPAVRPFALRLRDFEGWLGTGGDLEDLRRLGGPEDLHHLFQVELGTLVRRGPSSEGPSPAELLEIAQEAAAVGAVPFATPCELRQSLERVERRLHQGGAWRAGEPAWWAPLPPPDTFEDLWRELADPRGEHLGWPRRAEVRPVFADDGPRRLALPELLAPELLADVARELQAIAADGRLELERAGVGAEGEVSARRTDEVLYVDGTERALVTAAPHLAALVQWGLRRLAKRLGEAAGRPVFAPARAMLARYPAPSAGYAPHLDNPGGENDNGRELTLVVYLNAPDTPCVAGELALWLPGGSTEGEPAETVLPRGGAAAFFDAREVAHQVRPLGKGPPRWSLSFWLHDAPGAPPSPPPPPLASLTEALLPVEAPPIPEDRVLFHELSRGDERGRLVVYPRHSYRLRSPRAGIVTTTYQSGRRLDAWCAHHFALGFDHLAVVFDHPDEPEELAAAERLRAAWPEERLTIWRGDELPSRWHTLPKTRDWDELLTFAAAGSSSHAVASRQTLNASAALEAARGDELGGAPLDWLVHLDVDEFFHLEGPARGGAHLADHLHALEAAGLRLVRYVNHELLQGPSPSAAPCFKTNPRVAAARLGRRGFEAIVRHLKMGQTDPRPYFTGYHNGKSAVAVSTAMSAAGVHGFSLSSSATPAMQSFVAGPSVLHFHFLAREAFRRKYLRIAAAPPLPRARLFKPSPTEEAAVELLRELERQGADEATVHERLDALHARLTTFSDDDVEILEAARLLLRPKLEHMPPFEV